MQLAKNGLGFVAITKYALCRLTQTLPVAVVTTDTISHGTKANFECEVVATEPRVVVQRRPRSLAFIVNVVRRV